MQKGIKGPRTELLQVDNFLDTLKSKATKIAYGIQRDRYLKYGEPPNINNPLAVQNHIMGYLKDMHEEGLSWSYRTLAMSAIKHYYNALTQGQLILNWTWIAKMLGDNDTDNEIKAYTAEEIQKLLNVSDIKYRAIILMLASSGMRREALSEIKIRKDMEYLEEYGLYKITIYRSSKSKQIAFCSPEATTTIQTYLKEKEISEEENKNPSEWLFPARDLITKKGKPRGHIDPESLSIHLGKLAALAGLRDKQDNIEKETGFRNKNAAVQSLRKFTTNALAKSYKDKDGHEIRIPDEFQKILVGHTIGKVRAVYREPTEEELLNEYLKVLRFVTINQSLVVQAENTELKKAKSEIESLKDQIKEMQTKDVEEDDEIKMLREEFYTLKEQLRKKIAEA
jgi:site-specific recombinase XerD